ncbi:tetratricopeptide repeat protein [bacterium]|nr:MAG: tetratricopeptide repeat protein [bacterium]
MSLYKEIKRRTKDGDRTEIYRFAMILMVCFGFFLTIEVFTGGVPLLFLVFAPPIMAVIVMVIIQKAGGSISGSFYGGRKAAWNIKEQLAGDLENIRFSKRQGHFDEALVLTNDILKRFPNDPEALFLKAQILNEGFGYGKSAKKCLEIIIKEVPASETLHRWASSYYEGIISEGEIGQAASLSRNKEDVQ